MKIQLKRSNVLESSAAKQPTAGQMEYGELAVNYNSNDPAIFIKDSADQIVRIAGSGYDYNDLANLPTIGDGEITITANGETVGTFTVNQAGDTEIELPDSGKLNPPSPDEPGGDNQNGDLWLDTTDCPPVLKIWSDCDGTGQWYVLAAAGPQPINPTPDDGNNAISPPVSGSGTENDPFVLTAETIEYGETVQSAETIILTGQKPANLVQFYDINSGTNGSRFTQPVGSVAGDGTWSSKLVFEDTPDSTSELTYTGLLRLGSIYYKWDVSMLEPATLTVGKGTLSPTSGETGETFTGSATVTDAENPTEVHVFSMDGVEKQRGSSNTYVPSAEGSLTYHKEVTDDNNQSPVIGAESDAAVIIAPPGPTATMSGLRFDDTRATGLQGPYAVDGNFTVSFWAKPTNTTNNFVFSMVYSSDEVGIRVKDGKWNMYNNNGEVTWDPVRENTWQHVVLANEDGTLCFYLDGVKSANTIPANNISNGATIKIGFRKDGTADNNFDGYLSDCFFVDGKIAPPTTFGKFFPGDKWGPLDNAVVQDNLDNLQPADPTPPPGPGAAGQPYDSRANTDQVWSSNPKTGTDFASAPVTLAFNGELNSGEWFGQADDLPTLDIGIVAQESIRVYGKGGTGSGIGWSLFIDGSEVPINFGTNVLKWITASDFGVTFPCTFTSIANTSYNGGIAAIEVDGRLLVDQGVWDNSQNWSAGAQGGWKNIENAFDGITGGSAYAESISNSTGSIFFNDVTPGSSLKIYGNITNTAPTVKVNGVDVTSSFTTSGQWVDVSSVLAGGSLNSIEYTSTDGRLYIYAIEVDGKILVDAGAQWDTSQVWSAGATGSFSSSLPITNMFDGVIDETNRAAAASAAAVIFENLTVNSSLRIFTYSTEAGKLQVTLGGSDVDVTFGSDYEWRTVSLPSKPITLDKLTFVDTNPGVAGIEVDGKLLVDGTAVWNTDQVWSGSATGGNPSYPPANAFDGDLSTYSEAESGDEVVITFSTPLPLSSTFQAKQGTSSGQKVTLVSDTGNEAETATNGVASIQDLNKPTGSTVVSIKWRSDNAGVLYGVLLDGALLVDAAPTWNSSKEWSKDNTAAVGFYYSASGYYGGPGNAFNGSLNNYCLAGTGVGAYDTGVYAPSPTIAFNSLRINVEHEGTGSLWVDAGSGLVDVTADLEMSGNKGIYFTDTPGTLNRLEYRSSTAGNYCALGSVEINGKVLVDAGFGTSGFYLPFDPAQTGANYSSNWSADTDKSFNPATSVADIFNGAADNTGRLATTSFSGEGTVTLTPATQVSGSVELLLRTGGDPSYYDFSYSIDGGSTYVPVATPSSASTGQFIDFGNITISTANGLIIKENVKTGDSEIDIRGFMLDGVVLVDHSSIGVDMSGNENNFHDKNFVTGVNSSQSWDGTLVATTNGPLVDGTSAFDGSTETFAQTTTADLNASPGTLTFTPTSGITVNKSLRIYVFDNGNAEQNGALVYSSMTYEVNGSGAVDYQSDGPAGYRWVDTGFTGTLNTLAISGAKASTAANTNGAVELAAIEVDGSILSGSASGLDTVLDTPMKNYAVLNSTNTSNGNLDHSLTNAVTSHSTISAPVDTGKFYYEFTARADCANLTFGLSLLNTERTSSASDKNIWWYQNGSQAITSNNCTVTGTVGSALVTGDVVGVTLDNGSGAVFINGVQSFTYNSITDSVGNNTVFPGFDREAAGGVAASVNFGQQPFVYSQAGFEGIYQTWEQYARTTLGYALDRIAQLEALRLLDAVTIEDLRGQIAGALSRIASIESDEVNDDAADNALLALVGHLNSQVTTWTTRIEAAEAAIAAAEGRLDTLES